MAGSPIHLTFDCYGTLINWRQGILNTVQPYVNKHEIDTDQFFESWWKADRLSTLAESYRTYREILQLNYRQAFHSCEIPVPEPEVGRMVSELGNWPTFPDTNESLTLLKHRGYRLGILSNIDDDLLTETLTHFDVSFDFLITAQQVRSYKPSLNHFRKLIEVAGVEPAHVLHIAASRFVDIEPATKIGFKTLYVRRSEPDADYEIPADYVAKDLSHAVDLISRIS